MLRAETCLRPTRQGGGQKSWEIYLLHTRAHETIEGVDAPSEPPAQVPYDHVPKVGRYVVPLLIICPAFIEICPIFMMQTYIDSQAASNSTDVSKPGGNRAKPATACSSSSPPPKPSGPLTVDTEPTNESR